jgi:hypothetical protein
MHEAEGVNFSVGFIKKPDTGKDNRRIASPRSNYENITIDDILKFIDKLNIGKESKNKLIKIAKKIPNGSLSNFKFNYRNYLKNNN